MERDLEELELSFERFTPEILHLKLLRSGPASSQWAITSSRSWIRAAATTRATHKSVFWLALGKLEERSWSQPCDSSHCWGGLRAGLPSPTSGRWNDHGQKGSPDKGLTTKGSSAKFLVRGQTSWSYAAKMFQKFRKRHHLAVLKASAAVLRERLSPSSTTRPPPSSVCSLKNCV